MNANRQPQASEELSTVRPETKVFCPSVGTTLLGQIVIHMTTLVYTVGLCDPYVERSAEEMAPNADFSPNVINTVVFIVGWVMQINVYVTLTLTLTLAAAGCDAEQRVWRRASATPRKAHIRVAC